MREEQGGSELTGLIGALLGAAIGAALWALVGIAGYMASIVGLVIALLAGKGYDLLKGRPGKAKVAVLIVCVLLAVLAGNAGSYAYQVHDVYREQYEEPSELEKAYAMTEGEFFQVIMDDGEIQGEFVKDFGVGVFFAALGCFGVIAGAGAGKKKKQTASADEDDSAE